MADDKYMHGQLELKMTNWCLSMNTYVQLQSNDMWNKV